MSKGSRLYILFFIYFSWTESNSSRLWRWSMSESSGKVREGTRSVFGWLPNSILNYSQGTIWWTKELKTFSDGFTKSQSLWRQLRLVSELCSRTPPSWDWTLSRTSSRMINAADSCRINWWPDETDDRPHSFSNKRSYERTKAEKWIIRFSGVACHVLREHEHNHRAPRLKIVQIDYTFVRQVARLCHTRRCQGSPKERIFSRTLEGTNSHQQRKIIIQLVISRNSLDVRFRHVVRKTYAFIALLIGVSGGNARPKQANHYQHSRWPRAKRP